MKKYREKFVLSRPIALKQGINKRVLFGHSPAVPVLRMQRSQPAHHRDHLKRNKRNKI
jgi:hypothetical protein